MAKFVCNTDEVSATGKNIRKAASDINTSINSYSTNSDNALAKWSGVAKKSFQKANSSQASVATSDSEFIDALGQFIQESAKAIDDSEAEISTLKI